MFATVSDFVRRGLWMLAAIGKTESSGVEYMGTRPVNGSTYFSAVDVAGYEILNAEWSTEDTCN